MEAMFYIMLWFLGVNLALLGIFISMDWYWKRKTKLMFDNFMKEEESHENS
jgi:hypothetical protein